MTTYNANSVAGRDFDLALVLSGGNALGAFQAGVYEGLHEHGFLPDWVVGTSIGAINEALIAGSSSDRRLKALREFWRVDELDMPGYGTAWWSNVAETMRRTSATGWTIAAGRAGLFGPVLSALNPWASDQPSVFETEQLVATLEQVVDFDQLNSGTCRYTATAVDLGNGDDVVFDSSEVRIDARHVRASAALPVAFPPVKIDGRWLVDGGLSANLPLDPVFAAAADRPRLCIAVDLLPLSQPRPQTIGEAASRMQDLIFAAQSRRSMARWQAEYAGQTDTSLSLLRLAYTEQGDEVAGKAMDFSGPTIAKRWKAGRRTALQALDLIAGGSLGIGKAGLNVTQLD